MLQPQTPLPDRYTSATSIARNDMIGTAKAAPGDRLFALGHHYRRHDVIRWGGRQG